MKHTSTVQSTVHIHHQHNQLDSMKHKYTTSRQSPSYHHCRSQTRTLPSTKLRVRVHVGYNKMKFSSVALLIVSCFQAPMSSQAAPSRDIALKAELFSLITKNSSGHLDSEIINEFSTKLKAYAALPNVESSDILFAIGSSVFGVDIPPAKKESDTSTVEEPVIVDFEYMKQFMKDVFISYGCTEEQAEISSDVLIEADKRGIDSHGLGRLKPIYCDRIDKGILWANKPITVIKETETTALVDGNLGLGLTIGPHCMKLAIEKAKKYGVGFVAVQNSTHYGIAGYYTSMAADAGCVGFSGTNARPSIAPTFGVEPMLGE